jgi:hypothetical protein
MSCRIESVGSDLWRFCPETLTLPGQRLRALVRARLVDEIDGEPIRSALVSTPDPHLAAQLVPRVSSDGLVGLAGYPERLFPDLAGSAVSIPLRIEARGYLPLDLPGSLGPQPGFPDLFLPLDHGDIGLHRIGVALRGRAVERQTPLNLALPGAQIALSGVWSVYPPPGASAALLMEAPDLVSLVPGLYGDWAAASLERCTLVPNLPQAKTLLLPAVPGERRLRLADRIGLAAGQPLLLDPDDPGRRELIGVQFVDTAFSDDQPAWVELDYPLRHLHRQGVQALPAAIPATQDPRALARPAQCGDPLVFLAAAAPWPAASPIRVDDGLAPPEYQWADRFETVADGDGFFRLPRISRVALIQLEATHASQPAPLLLTLEPDYGLAEQPVQVAFE